MYYELYTISDEVFTGCKNVSPAAKLIRRKSKKEVLNFMRDYMASSKDCLACVVFEKVRANAAPTGLEFYHNKKDSSRAMSIWGEGVSAYLRRDYLAYLLGDTKTPPFKAESVYPTLYTTIVFTWTPNPEYPSTNIITTSTVEGDKAVTETLKTAIKAYGYEYGLCNAQNSEQYVQAQTRGAQIHSLFTHKSLFTYKSLV